MFVGVGLKRRNVDTSQNRESAIVLNSVHAVLPVALILGKLINLSMLYFNQL